MIIFIAILMICVAIFMLPGEQPFAKCRFDSDGKEHDMEDVEITYTCDGPINKEGTDNEQVEATAMTGRCKRCGAWEENLDW